MLTMKGPRAGYGTQMVLHDINMTVVPGEIVTLIGANGAGKSTLLKCLAGMVVARRGTIMVDGNRVDALSPKERVIRDVCLVAEGRQMFGGLTVEANLRLGAYVHPRMSQAETEALISDCCRPFPILLPRRHETCAILSGGQQQMLAIARGLMAKPKVLMLDEPSLGLSPTLVAEIFRLISKLRDRGLGILLSAQNARQSLAISDRAYVFENGRIVAKGSSSSILESDDIAGKYLGVGAGLGQGDAVRQSAVTERLRSILLST